MEQTENLKATAPYLQPKLKNTILMEMRLATKQQQPLLKMTEKSVLILYTLKNHNFFHGDQIWC